MCSLNKISLQSENGGSKRTYNRINSVSFRVAERVRDIIIVEYFNCRGALGTAA